MRRSAVLITAGLVIATLIPLQLYAGWVKTYGGGARDWGFYVQQTPDGAYIVGGFTSSAGTTLAEDVWLLKIDSEGDTLWTRAYGGEKMDHAYCVQQTSDGGYILVGLTQSFARLGNQDLWLLKTDSEGDTLWTRIYGGDGGEYDYDEGYFVQETTDGCYIVVGRKSDGGTDLWLLKIDEAGNTLWTRTYDLTEAGYWNWGFCVRQTMDGGYILTGSSTIPENVHQALTLVKTDANGDTLWTRLYYGGEGRTTFGTSVQQTPDGGYIVGGFRTIPGEPGQQRCEFWLLKTDENGDILWTRSYARKDFNEIFGLDQTTDGGYILAGISGELGLITPCEIWLVKTDAWGDTLWTRTFEPGGSRSEGTCVQQTSDGGYIITGNTGNTPGAIDLCLIKTDSLGDTTEVPAVSENLPLETETNWHLLSSIGHSIILEYHDLPQGFHASIFDASGRKVDELHSADASGTIIWPVTPPVTHPATPHSQGVYFIRVESDKSGSAHKVVLMK